jgi:hypothetical protein
VAKTSRRSLESVVIATEGKFLSAEFERALSNEIDVFVQQHGPFPEIRTLTSLAFARRGTTRSAGSQSDLSLNDPRLAVRTALSLREAGFREAEPSTGIGFSQGL